MIEHKFACFRVTDDGVFIFVVTFKLFYELFAKRSCGREHLVVVDILIGVSVCVLPQRTKNVPTQNRLWHRGGVTIVTADIPIGRFATVRVFNENSRKRVTQSVNQRAIAMCRAQLKETGSRFRFVNQIGIDGNEFVKANIIVGFF